MDEISLGFFVQIFGNVAGPLFFGIYAYLRWRANRTESDLLQEIKSEHKSNSKMVEKIVDKQIEISDKIIGHVHVIETNIGSLKEGCKEISISDAEKIFKNTFRETARCLGFEIRALTSDDELFENGKLIAPLSTLAKRFKSIVSDSLRTQSKSVKGMKCNGYSLGAYIRSTTEAQNQAMEYVFRNLISHIEGKPTEIGNLETKLSQMKNLLLSGAEEYLRTGQFFDEDLIDDETDDD